MYGFIGTLPLCTANVNMRFNVIDRKSTRLNSSHANISYAVFCLKKKKYALRLEVHVVRNLNDIHEPLGVEELLENVCKREGTIHTATIGGHQTAQRSRFRPRKLS